MNLLGFAVLGVGFHDIINAFYKVKALNDGQHSWGFGQLTATAVWFLVVLKFARTVLRVMCMWLVLHSLSPMSFTLIIFLV